MRPPKTTCRDGVTSRNLSRHLPAAPEPLIWFLWSEIIFITPSPRPDQEPTNGFLFLTNSDQPIFKHFSAWTHCLCWKTCIFIIYSERCEARAKLLSNNYEDWNNCNCWVVRLVSTIDPLYIFPQRAPGYVLCKSWLISPEAPPVTSGGADKYDKILASPPLSPVTAPARQ